MAGSQSIFSEVVRAAYKGKVIAEAISPLAKRARLMEEVIMLPLPPPPPMAEKSAHL